MAKLPKNLTIDMICDAIADDDNSGFCLVCGEQQYNCEPDARNYECESCGAKQVFGAEECLIMFG